MRMLYWIRSRYNGSTQLRLTIYFLLVLLPLVLVSLHAISRSEEIVLQQSIRRTEGSLRAVTNSIDTVLQNVEELSRLVATDKNLVPILSEAGTVLSPQAIYRFSELIGKLWNVTAISRTVSEVSVYHADSGTLVSTKSGAKKVEDDSQRAWLLELAADIGSGTKYLLPDDGIRGERSFGDLTGTDSVSLVRVMDSYNAYRQPNLLIITLNRSRLYSIMESVLPSKDSRIFLYTKNGRLVAGTGTGQDGVNTADMNAEPALIEAGAISPNFGWTLRILQPEAEIYRETRQIRHFTNLIIAVSILLSILISWGVYSRIAWPLKRLSHGMRELSGGNYDLRLHHSRSDEFGFVMNLYNQMARDQKHLIEDYYEQQLRLSHTELKFLQSQINPHFLYNTLDSIYWSAKNYEAEEIGEMVLNLSRFFRLSLNKGREAFTLKETVEHLHYYVRVQQLRYLDSFTVNYRIGPGTEGLTVLKLLLQPLVENALQHGLKGREEGGELTLRSVLEGDRLVLTVTDNGLGIAEERLHRIQEELASIMAEPSRPVSHGEGRDEEFFGLRNVCSRVRMFYGSESGMQVDSTAGEGTTVRISLPVDKCGREALGLCAHECAAV
ncbi:two-component sensor histidine kinase YesN-like protein [Paenibacillus mucilaginosus 3016]|uniref:histidine kinase n=1 Tax=Paenibacillus mucilaginosus 3016 TaxID=1116391 RepID=H6NNM1_9BACL|nr:sensor histidine kinase [Paenibacillus mucilaginosus]AFC33342.1 two-component sensor histidine kinase YesN-like protein [Paenibacillus mucilaginosus 3016]WFA21758.1 sensor histidine kinase [Paenibacillus mucilaginosus]